MGGRARADRCDRRGGEFRQPPRPGWGLRPRIHAPSPAALALWRTERQRAAEVDRQRHDARPQSDGHAVRAELHSRRQPDRHQGTSGVDPNLPQHQRNHPEDAPQAGRAEGIEDHTGGAGRSLGDPFPRAMDRQARRMARRPLDEPRLPNPATTGDRSAGRRQRRTEIPQRRHQGDRQRTTAPDRSHRRARRQDRPKGVAAVRYDRRASRALGRAGISTHDLPSSGAFSRCAPCVGAVSTNSSPFWKNCSMP